MPPEIEATPGVVPVDATATPVVVEQEEGKPTAKVPEGEGSEATEGSEGDGDKPKPELTAEQKEIYALKRRIGRLTNQKAQAEAQIELTRKETAERARAAETPEGAEAEKPPQLTDEEVDKRARALSAQREEQRTLTENVEKTIKAGRKAFKDFDAKTAVVDEEIGGFADAHGRLRPLTAAIFDADQPHELISYLAEHPEEAAELAEMPPIRQIRRIAQIEIEMGKTSKPKPSGAPKPITPVKGSGGGSDEPDPKDSKAWIAWRNKTAAR